MSSIRYYPTLSQAKKLARDGNLVPIYREISADLETPVSAYLKVARPPYSFLLESVEGGERLARYSFIGTEPAQVLKTGQGQPAGAVDPLIAIKKILDGYRSIPVPGLPRFHGGAVGYLACDVVHYFEPSIPLPESDPLGLPEAVLMFTDSLLIFDHLKHSIKVVSNAYLDGNLPEAYKSACDRIDTLVNRLASPIPIIPEVSSQGAKSSQVTSNFTMERYKQAVRTAKEYIYAGDIIQVVLSQRLAKETNADPFRIYRMLRTINPSPYMYYLDLGDFHIIGASPEMLVRVDEREVATHPIAGTRPRGDTPESDAVFEKDLLSSDKERAEHTMLLDLGRNDIGRVSEPNTIKVSQLMEVERYSHVMHLVSHVLGQLSPSLTVYDAFRACFPAGTVSGAPKIRAMAIVKELEGERRGPYAGAVGYFSYSGNMDAAITIRTIVLKDGVAYVQAGGGVVADSTPEGEYQETLDKASALLRAISEAEQ